MSKDPRSTVELKVAMALALTRRWQRRSYGGIRPGVGRKMAVVTGLAEQIAGYLLFAVEVWKGEQPVSDVVVAALIADVLTSFPEREAHAMAGRDITAAEAARDRLVAQVASALMTDYEIRVKAYTGLPAIEPSGLRMGTSNPTRAVK